MLSRLVIMPSILLLSLYATAQQDNGAYKVYYEMKFRKDSTESTITSEITELLVNENKSLFRTVSQAERDTNKYYKGPMTPTDTYIHTNARYRIVKDYASQETQYYEQVETLGGPIYTYTESQDSMTWLLTSDTLTINRLPCQKATLRYGGRSWEAWFCPDIPISDGPYKFRGLPGLIVRIRDSTDSWLFDLTNITPVPPFSFDLAFLKNAVAIDKRGLYKRKWDYRYNWLQINEAAGKIGPIESEQMRQRLIKSSRANLAKDNNWIELYH